MLPLRLFGNSSHVFRLISTQFGHPTFDAFNKDVCFIATKDLQFLLQSVLSLSNDFKLSNINETTRQVLVMECELWYGLLFDELSYSVSHITINMPKKIQSVSSLIQSWMAAR